MSINHFFDKDRSKYIKGFTIVLMLIHHLFAFDSRIENVNYKNVIFIIVGILGMGVVAGKLLSHNTISSILILKLLLNVIANQSAFIMGCIFCKLNIFDHIFHKSKIVFLII